MAGPKKNGHCPSTLVINADNGPENSGSRSQWLKRLVQFSARFGVKVQLAYYPPYHSKYNPIERVFGVFVADHQETYFSEHPPSRQKPSSSAGFTTPASEEDKLTAFDYFLRLSNAALLRKYSR